jgi:NAD(P)H-dependent flavin oxidoreductase YrpB (nitropropane dioxygenase family)
MRVILTEGLRVALGREADAMAEARGRVAGTVTLGGERVTLPGYSANLPMRAFEGDIEQTCLTAGQSAGNIHAVLPAARIVRQMTEEAEAVLAGLASAARRKEAAA